ncbi:MAG: hypothetical protein WCA21_18875 [Terracidiphilus sp.]
MNRDKFLTFFVVASLIGMVLLLIFQSSHNFHDFIRQTLELTALCLGYVGLEELGRSGHKKLYRILRSCLFLLFVAMLTLIGLLAHYKITACDFVIDDSLYLFLVLFTTLFPLSLYLNRNRNKSTSQQTSANEP